MTTARELRTAPPRVLRDHIVRGYPVDPARLEGWAYRGTSLGLPKLVEKLSWKTFQKTFYRDQPSGRLLGWNVRLEQDGIDAPSRPRLKKGKPVTEWNYEVVSPAGVPMPEGFDRGLVIDYGRAPNPPGVMSLIKDPLVSLSPDNAEELIGVSYLVVGGRCIETPTYFTLERDRPIDHVPAEIAEPRSSSPLDLTRAERAWAEALFEAIVATSGEAGLPPFSSVDRGAFWRCFGEAPSPLVRAGLRPMLYALTFLPAASGLGGPFYSLSPAAKAAFLEQASRDRRYFVRQSLVTLKTLACFAYFEDPAVRARFERPAAEGAFAPVAPGAPAFGGASS